VRTRGAYGASQAAGVPLQVSGERGGRVESNAIAPGRFRKINENGEGEREAVLKKSASATCIGAVHPGGSAEEQLLPQKLL